MDLYSLGLCGGLKPIIVFSLTATINYKKIYENMTKMKLNKQHQFLAFLGTYSCTTSPNMQSLYICMTSYKLHCTT